LFFLILITFADKTPPTTEPLIKLTPMIKLMGKFIVSFFIKLTLPLVVLFWMLTISIKKKQELSMLRKANFLKKEITFKQLFIKS